MERTPRPEKEPILPRAMLAWLVVGGIILGGTALGIIWWAEDAHDAALARTMGMTTFAIANVFLAFTVKDELRSILDVETFADRKLLLATGLSAATIVAGTELRFFQRLLETVSLTGQQWVTCILAASTILVASEIQKLVRRRRPAQEAETAGVPVLTAR